MFIDPYQMFELTIGGNQKIDGSIFLSLYRLVFLKHFLTTVATGSRMSSGTSVNATLDENNNSSCTLTQKRQLSTFYVLPFRYKVLKKCGESYFGGARNEFILFKQLKINFKDISLFSTAFSCVCKSFANAFRPF